MTNPCGKSFFSYRRTRAGEAALMIQAQHDRGIPTWQDVTNLDEAPAEDGIRQVLGDSNTANAVLWLTPEVADSPMIRKVEIPMALTRQKAKDSFFVMPVAAGGNDYDSASRVADGHIGIEDLRGWNLKKVANDPIQGTDACCLADRILAKRIEAVHAALPTAAPLKLMLNTRRKLPYHPDVAIAIDWTNHFTGREADRNVWDITLLPALAAVASGIEVNAPARQIEASGLLSIPAAVALGSAFLAPRNLKIGWRQYFPDQKTEQVWSLSAERESTPVVTVDDRGSSVNARDLAVLVSIAQNVETAFGTNKARLGEFRAIIQIAAPNKSPFAVASPGAALDIARKVRDAILDARAKYVDLGTVHLFLAVPVGLAMLIGQLLNTLGPVQTYEHVPATDGVGEYKLAALLRPSF